MPRYAVDFIADIEELNDYPGSEHEVDYPKSEIKEENNVCGTEMGNVQCLFTIGERQQNRRIVVSRGTQCDKTVQPQLTSIRQENISSVKGGLLSDYTSQFLKSSLNASIASTTSDGQQEEVIMGRLSHESCFKKPPDLKDNVRLKNKREQLLQKLEINATEDEPDSLSDTLSDLELKCELQEHIQRSRLYNHKTRERPDTVKSDVYGNTNENLSKTNIADVLVVADEEKNEINDEKHQMKRMNPDFENFFKMSERGDSEPRTGLSFDDTEHLYMNENCSYNQNNTGITKCSSPYNHRKCRRRKSINEDTKNAVDNKNSYPTTDSNCDKMMMQPNGNNHRPLNMSETTPVVNLPPKPPRHPQGTPNFLPDRLSNTKRMQSLTLRNSTFGDVPSPVEEVIEHNLVAQGGYNLDSPPINPSRSPHQPQFQIGDFSPVGPRTRTHSEPRGMTPRGFYYPSRIPQPVTHKFYVCESDGIGDILADTTDRRIKAVCDRHRCDIAIYSPIVRGGYMKYIVMLTAPSASEMKKCVRSLDTTLKWNLSSQLK